MIVLDGVEVRVAGRVEPVLAGVDLALTAGEVVAIVGANGSGKSTLARVACGLAVPDAGRCTLAPGARVGLVGQDPVAQVIAETVAEDVAFGLAGRVATRAELVARTQGVLESHDLVALAERDPRALSGGQQQRVAIAAAVACDVDLLVLDEPTSQLDARHRALLGAVVAREVDRGCAVLWVTQLAGEVAACARVVALDAGRVAFDGTTRELYARRELVEHLNIDVPPAVRLAWQLADRGVAVAGATPLALDELAAML